MGRQFVVEGEGQNSGVVEKECNEKGSAWWREGKGCELGSETMET